MDFEEMGSDATESNKAQDGGEIEIEDEEVPQNDTAVACRDEHIKNSTELMDAYSKDMVLHDQDFIPNLRKEELALMAEGHERSHSRFDVDEHLEVQLRFDLGSLVDAHMLLDTNGPRDSHWDFMRQEQSGLAFQATSEENVSLMAHPVKPDEVKSFDNCQAWPRSSSSHEDAQLFLDAQDEVSMIADAFGSKGRSVVEDSAEPEAGLVAYVHHDKANAWIDLSGKEQLQPSVDVHHDKANAWIDLSGKEQLQARGDADIEFDDRTDKDGGESQLHSNQSSAMQTTELVIDETKTKTNVFSDCGEGKTSEQCNSSRLDNTMVERLRESGPTSTADVLESMNHEEEGESPVLEARQDRAAEESTQLETESRLEIRNDPDQKESEERSAVLEKCPNEARSSGQLDASQATKDLQGHVLECIETISIDLGKMQTPSDGRNKQSQMDCDKGGSFDETSMLVTEISQQPEGKAFCGDHVQDNLVTGEQFTGHRSGSERQAEDAHDLPENSTPSQSVSSLTDASSSKLVATSVSGGAVVGLDEKALGCLSIASEGCIPRCDLSGKDMQGNEGKSGTEDEEATSGKAEELAGQEVHQIANEVSGQVVPNFDNATQELSNDEVVLKETVACKEVKQDQEGLSSVSESNLEIQSVEAMPRGVTGTVEENNDMGPLVVVGFPSDNDQRSLVEAENLVEIQSVEAMSRGVTGTVEENTDMSPLEVVGFPSDNDQRSLVGAENLVETQSAEAMSRGVTGTVEENTDMGPLEVVGFPSDNDQRSLVEAENLADSVTRRVSHLAMLDHPGACEHSETLHAEEVPVRQHLGSSVEPSDHKEVSAGIEKTDPRNEDMGESSKQSKVFVEGCILGAPNGSGPVGCPAGGHLITDSSDVQEEQASSRKQQHRGIVSAVLELQRESSQSNSQAECTEGLGDSGRVVGADGLLSQSKQLEDSMEEICPSAQVQSTRQGEDGTPCEAGPQHSDIVMTDVADGSRISSVTMAILEEKTTNVELEVLAVSASESNEGVEGQSVAFLAVEDTTIESKNVAKQNGMDESADAKVSVEVAPVSVLNAPPVTPGQVSDVSGIPICAENECLGLSLHVNMSEPPSSPYDITTAQAQVSNAVAGSSQVVDIDMEDVPEAESERKNVEKQQEETGITLYSSTEVSPAPATMVCPEEVIEVRLVEKSKEISQVGFGQSSADKMLGPLEVFSIDSKASENQIVEENAKSGVQDHKDSTQLSPNNKVAAEAASTEAGNDACEDAGSKQPEEVSKAQLDEDCPSGIKLKKQESEMPSEETTKEAGNVEFLESKQASLPSTSRQQQAGNQTADEPAGPIAKPDVVGEASVTTSEHENKQLSEGKQVLVEVFHAESQIHHTGSQVFEVLERSPHPQNQGDELAKSEAMADEGEGKQVLVEVSHPQNQGDELAKSVAMADEGEGKQVLVEVSHTESQIHHTESQVLEVLELGPLPQNQVDQLSKSGAMTDEGETAQSNTVHNETVQVQKNMLTKDQLEDVKMQSPKAAIALTDSQATTKHDVAARRAEETSEEQIRIEILVSSVGASTEMATYISESARSPRVSPRVKEDKKSGMTLLKETACPAHDDQAQIGMLTEVALQDDVDKSSPVTAKRINELPLSKNKDAPCLEPVDNQALDTVPQGYSGTSQAQPRTSQENTVRLKKFQGLGREDGVKHASDMSSVSKFNLEGPSQIQHNTGSIQGTRGNGGSASVDVLLPDRGSKPDVPISMVQDGKVLMQAADKAERRLEVTKEPPSLVGSGATDVNNSLAPNETSSRNRVLDGRDALSRVRAPSNIMRENPQTTPNIIRQSHPLNSRQQTTLPDLNVVEVAPLTLVAQPFNDSQQVQLRAQILVYGSLIQGSLPEEALMLAAFSDITGAARWETGRDAAEGGRVFWEKSWRTAAERVQNRILLRDPAHSVAVSLAGIPSASSTRISEGISASLGSGAASCTADARIPVLNARFPETPVSTPGSKGHFSRARQSGAGKIGSRSNSAALLNSPRLPPSTPVSTRALPSPLSESLQTPQAGRAPHVDLQQLPARTFFPTPQLGPFVSGSTHWLSPSPFPGPWIPPPQQAGFDSSVSFTHTQPIVGSEVTQEAASSRRSTSSSRVPVLPVIPIVPPFSPPVIGSSPTLASAASDTGAVQKSNAGLARQAAVESRSRKRKKTQSETASLPVDMVGSGGFSVSSPETVSVVGSRTTATTSVPLWSPTSHQAVSCTSGGLSIPLSASPECLAMVVVTTQVSSAGVETPLPALPANHASTPLLTNGLNVHSTNPSSQGQLVPIEGHQERPVLSENFMSHVEQARSSAEEATSIAASAVRESESMWSRLQAQSSSGCVSDTETKLVSSAIAMAAAASVAKAAAAAARVAYAAALQAKVMREEALEHREEANGSHTSGGRSSEDLALKAHTSDENDNNSSASWQMPNSYKSIIATAKEAAKKKLESASAARMRAQNIDSVVRAAELATAAVSQVGAVVAMGESIPFTLDMLLEAGPEGFHRLGNMESLGTLPGKERANQKASGGKSPGKSEKPVKGKSLEQSKKNISRKGGGGLKESCIQEAGQDGNRVVEPEPVVVLDLPRNDKESQGNEQRDAEIENISKEAEAIEPPGTAAQSGISQNEGPLPVEAEPDPRTVQGMPCSPVNQIMKGSVVEVLSDEEGLRGVWFSAKVLNVEGGKTLVLYDELLSDDGPDQLEEWIDLEGASGEAPRVRLAHPMTRMKFEGTRKRRRAAMGNNMWSVGDRVDAWIRDGWWEGEILDTCEENESKVKVFFPGEGDTALIKSWNLRPSLVWNNGHWVLWTDIKLENNRPQETSITVHKGESPLAKRQKVEKEQTNSLNQIKEKAIEARSRENVAISSRIEENHVESAVKRHKDGGVSAIDRLEREIPANEGSKVVFGVPKPTKKRKFMEVSKHYAPNRVTRSSPEGKATGKNEGHKTSTLEFRMGSAEARKVDDAKAKKKFPSKQPQLKVRKDDESGERIRSKNVTAKTEREKPFAGFGMGTRKEVSGRDGAASGPSSIKNNAAKMIKKKVPLDGHQSDAQKSSVNTPSMVPKELGIRKPLVPTKSAAISADSERVVKEKQSYHSTKENEKDKDPGKSGTELLEPRRSSRKIQPTSKLLEGLQSTPKLGKNGSSSLQDKGNRLPLKTFMSAVKGLLSPQKQ